jgi:ribosomal-protein-alanine N-acetyltransferase
MPDLDNFPCIYSTERTHLAKPKPDDALDLFHEVTSDSNVVRYLSWKQHDSQKETEKFLSKILEMWDSGEAYTATLSLNGTYQLLGLLAMRPTPHGIALGFVLGRRWWGFGFMTEVLKSVIPWWLTQYEVHRVFATTHISNNSASSVLIRSGMQFEGTLKRYSVFPNIQAGPQDCSIFAKTR